MVKHLRVGYVPEHFSAPLTKLAAEGTANIELVVCAEGTGQMRTALKDNAIDVAVALTESLIAGIANGQADYTLVGSYIKTPLNWAVITGANRDDINSISDIWGKKIAISRVGSGSQVMASVMALNEGWLQRDGVAQLDFSICGSFENLRKAVNEPRGPACFMWEHFTTKPYRDSNEVKFVGNVHTPWPSWMIAARKDAPAEVLKLFLGQLSTAAAAFDSEEGRAGSSQAYIREHFKYEPEDIEAWIKTVGYVEKMDTISEKVLRDTLRVLGTAGVVNRPVDDWQVSQFVDTKVATVI